jgi:hypothetical protein
MKSLFAALAIFSMLGLSACQHMGSKKSCGGCAQDKSCTECKDKGTEKAAGNSAEKSGGCADCKK